MGPAQLAEVLRALPKIAHPDLLVGFETSDDAGIFRVSENLALVQTMDFFTPIVDDPYSYGGIAAANALSDVYAMGGRPITAMNIACFSPSMAPLDIWAQVFHGLADKCAEAKVALVGGHTVEDKQPKFGLSVTGLVDPERIFSNTSAKPGDMIYLSKPLGTGIITTAAKFDGAPADALDAAVQRMLALNREACEYALDAGVRCATDITGFGLAGHLSHVAKASHVAIEVASADLPLLPQLRPLIEAGHTTGGAAKNAEYLEPFLRFSSDVPIWMREIVLDPQTSGGLCMFSQAPIASFPCIGRVLEGQPAIIVV